MTTTVRMSLICAAAAALAAQTPTVHMLNLSHPGAADFQIGDRFQAVVAGPPGAPVSLRTIANGRTDWGPVIANLDDAGEWSTTGQFATADFGDWTHVWTVGGKLATPVVELSVQPPCLKGGFALTSVSSRAVSVQCDTAEGRRTFATRSDTEPFRTPDGRWVAGRLHSYASPEAYQMEIMESFLRTGPPGPRIRQRGDDAAVKITQIIGPNALSDKEIGNVCAIVRAAFGDPAHTPEAAKRPSATIALLHRLEAETEDAGVQQSIEETIRDIQMDPEVGR
ncbi:MAG TPA: hypothetical protein VFA04_02475 [Bryobacteraceae bacterium]|nr:hypothetical protein [Bryobacteraceae bacterium]